MFLRHYVRSLLVESKVDDLKKKYPNVDVDLYADNDPSRNNKYLEWMVKQAVKGHSQEDIIATVSYFHINVVRFKSKDINAYKDLKDLENEVKEVSQTKSKTQQKKEIKASGSDDVYEDDEVIVKHIKEKDACQVYGAGTKWCITMSNTSYWEQYVGANVVFYYMLRKQPLNDDFDKVAFAVQRDGRKNVHKIEYFNAKDDKVNERTLSSYFKQFSKIFDLVKEHASNVEKGLLAKIKDKEATEEEVKRAFDLYKDDSKTLEYLLSFIESGKIDVETLTRLASHENAEVRKRVALNISAPKEVLIELASDENASVRCCVAGARFTPPKTLVMLASDKNKTVRSFVASNNSAPPEALIKLASDEYEEVRRYVANNPSTPEEVLILLASDKEEIIRSCVALNSSTSSKILIKLASDRNWRVREAVVKNPSTPREVLEKLLLDPKLHDKVVKVLAKRYI